jgi:2-oxo-4-hydroxy-4-carboxy-5-ureidoimidazoline decarboxylase
MRLPTQRGTETPLDRLNSIAVEQAESVLLTCCGSRRWARRLAGHRPFPDQQSLLAAAEAAGHDLTTDDLCEALAAESGAHHPLAPLTGSSATEGTGTLAAHAAYQSRFGHAFVICLDALPAEERLTGILTGIRTRLSNDAEEERATTAEELRCLARGRLLRLMVSDITAGSLSVPD